MGDTDTAHDYLSTRVDFGGEAMTRAEVFAWFERQGYERRAAEMWWMGWDLTHGRRT